MLRASIFAIAGLAAINPNAFAQPVQDQNFEVVRLLGKPVNYDRAPSLAFGFDGRARGHGGCNTYGATYSVKSVLVRAGKATRPAKTKSVRIWTVRFQNISSTRMYCGLGSMVESRFFDALKLARRYRLKDGTLSIYGARNRTPLIVLTKVAM